ncbi:MAG: sigma-70 family RNA polymerase sigma factor [Planctomycetota bacterium]
MDERMKAYSAEFLASRHGLMAFILGTIRNPVAAEDVFQDVWLRLVEAGGEGQAIDSVPAWCRGVARNLILHHWREHRRPTVCADDGVLDLMDAAMRRHVDGNDIWETRLHALSGCMERLSADARQLLQLKYEQGLPCEEIAQRMHRTSAGVMMALSRVRQALAECIGRRIASDEAIT